MVIGVCPLGPANAFFPSGQILLIKPDIDARQSVQDDNLLCAGTPMEGDPQAVAVPVLLNDHALRQPIQWTFILGRNRLKIVGFCLAPSARYHTVWVSQTINLC